MIVARVALVTCVLGLAATGVVAPPAASAVAPGISDEGQIAYGQWGRNWFDQRLVVQNADGTNRRVVRRDDEGNLGGAELSPNGKWLALTPGYGSLSIRHVDRKGLGEPIMIGAEYPSTVAGVSWSPDGTRLAFTALSADRESRDLIVADVATRQGTVLVHGQPDTYGSAWSPDGKWIAFERTSDAVGCLSGDHVYYYDEIVTIHPDGTAATVVTADRPWDWHLEDWGERGILAETTQTGDDGDPSEPCASNHRADLLDPDSGTNRRLSYYPDTRPIALSPDGTSYLLTNTTTTSQMWRADLDSKDRVLLTARGLGLGDWGNLPSS